jgi:sterol desaturase/sphingolipid hydroxylase (fatty acid hydroxylase superfamily)
VLTWLPLALAAEALLLFLAERRRPVRHPRKAFLARLLVNLALAAGVLLVAGGVVRPLVLRVLMRPAGAPLGLLDWLRLPPLVEGAIAFGLIDLTFYWWHRANHRVPVLWRFHNVHHVDLDLDVSTALRFHVGEVALSAAFRVAQVVAIAPSLAAFWVYEACFEAGTLFHHSNLRLPLGLERRLARLLVTPRMHGIHHSQVEREASSNYSVVLSCWDRLHRTLRLNVPQRAIEVGVPAHATAADQRLAFLIALPFRRQRDHWRRPDGTVPDRGELPGPLDELAE